jgi:hypothetical protein
MTAKKKDDAQFPNGNSDVDRLIKQYRSCTKESAANTIKMSHTSVEATKTLNVFDQQKFCDELKISKSTRSKLETIAKAASRFDPFLEKCPSSWTTLYAMAKLKSNEFDQVAHHQLFAPTMTAAEIDEIVKGKSGSGGDLDHKVRSDLIIELPQDIKDIDVSKGRELCDKIMKAAEQCGCKYKISDAVNRKLAPPAEKPSLVKFMRSKEAA